MKWDDDVNKYDGGERDAQCHEVEQEEFQSIFCLIIKYLSPPKSTDKCITILSRQLYREIQRRDNWLILECFILG